MLVQSLGVFEKVFPNGMTFSNSIIISIVGFLIVFVVLGVLALFVKSTGLFFESKNNKATEDVKTEDVKEIAPSAPVTVSDGPVLEGVSEPEAAVIMAIVSNESGIPLNRLKFNSIKFKEDVK